MKIKSMDFRQQRWILWFMIFVLLFSLSACGPDPKIVQALKEAEKNGSQIIPGTVRIYSSTEEIKQAQTKYYKAQGNIGKLNSVRSRYEWAEKPDNPYRQYLKESYAVLELEGDPEILATNAASEPKPRPAHYIFLTNSNNQDAFAYWKAYENHKVVLIVPSIEDIFWQDENVHPPFFEPVLYEKKEPLYEIPDFRLLVGMKGTIMAPPHTWSFADFSGSYACYSGAGAWGLEFTLKPDGSFSLSYHDSDSDQIVRSKLTGKLSNFKVTDKGYTFTIESLQSPVSPGEEKVEHDHGVPDRLVYNDFGMKKGGTGMIYPPGSSLELFPEEMRNMMHAAQIQEERLTENTKTSIVLSPKIGVWQMSEE